MKKHYLLGLLLVILSMATPMQAWAELTLGSHDFNDGAGSVDAYPISSAADLTEFSGLVNSGNTAINGYLTADIDMQGVAFTAIGKVGSYSGKFDGCNNTISNLRIESTGLQGLFGTVKGGLIENVTLTGGSIKGNIWVGGIAGRFTGVMRNCHNENKVTGEKNVGGLCGETNQYHNGTGNVNSTIEGCYNTGEVNSLDTVVSTPTINVGGLVGNLYSTNLSKSYNTGEVVVTSVNAINKIGGIAGYVYGGSITDCYNTANVKCVDYESGAAKGENIGGIAGLTKSGASVQRCFSTGAVVGLTSVGGAVGSIDDSNGTCTVADCYYNSDFCSAGAVAGAAHAGVTSLTITQMTGTDATGRAEASMSALDFTNTWATTADVTNANGSKTMYYPQLKAFAGIDPVGITPEIPSLVVTTANDIVDAYDEQISLREAIAYAGTGGLGSDITFDPTVFATSQTITLDPVLGTLTIDKDLTIDGHCNNGDKVILDGGNSGNGATDGVRIIDFTSSGSVLLSNLTFQNGHANFGGAIAIHSGTLTVTNSPFIGNSAIYGGAVSNSGTFITSNCTFSGNSVSGGDGGAVKNLGSFTTINCTYSGNSSYSGGAIVNERALYMVNNIVVGNGDSQIKTYDAIATDKYNITTGNVGDIFAEVSDGKATLNADGTFHIKANGVAAYGGTLVALKDGMYYFKDGVTWRKVTVPTATSETGLTVIVADQNNPNVRNRGAAANSGIYAVGAYFVEPVAETPSLVVNTTNGSRNPYDGFISLHDAIAYAGTGELGSDITFDPTVFATSQTITLGSTLIIDKDLTIDGAGKVILDGGDTYDGTTVTTHSGVRIMEISLGRLVELSNLTFQNGYTATNGGAIYNAEYGTLIIVNSIFKLNTANKGGAIYNDGYLSLDNTSFSGNAADNGGAVYSAGSSPLLVTGSSFMANQARNGGAISLDVAAESGVVAITIDHSYFTGNTASGNGGAIYSDNSTSDSTLDVAIINSVIHSNTANGGGGIYNNGANVKMSVVNSTVSLNTVITAADGTQIVNNRGNLYLINDIVVGTAGTNNKEILNGNSGSLYLYSTVTGGITSDGTGTLTQWGQTTGAKAEDIFVSTAAAQTDLAIKTSGAAAINGTLAGNILVFSPTMGNGDFYYLRDNAWYKAGDDTATITFDPADADGNYGLGDSNEPGVARKAYTEALNADEYGSPVSRCLAMDYNIYNAGAYAIDSVETPDTVVTTAQDVVNPFDNLISLREAIAYAGANGLGNTITFDATVFATAQTIMLDSTLNIEKNLTIDGAGKVILDGNNAVQIMNIAKGKTVTLSNLTFQNGYVNGLGGAINNKGLLTINNSTFSGNSATSLGGAINNERVLTINNSTFSGNSATSYGGVIRNSYTLRINNSTFFGNSAKPGGGAIFNMSSLTVANSTFSGNETTSPSGKGGAICNNNGDIYLLNSIFVGNSANDDLGTVNTGGEINAYYCVYGTASVTIGGANNVSGATAAAVFGSNTFDGKTIAITDTGAAARSGTLTAVKDGVYYFKDGSNGWKRLSNNSAASDMSAYAITNDQLGTSRLGTAAGLGFYAAGAYFVDAAPETASIVVTTTEDVINPYDGLISFREAVENYAEAGSTITFSGSNGTLLLPRSVNVNKNITIGDGFILSTTDEFNDLLIAANNTESVTFENVTIKNGNVNMGEGGIAITSGKTLKVAETSESWFTSSTFTNNGTIEVVGTGWDCSADNFGNVIYSFADAQVLAGTYNNLTLSGSGIASANNNITVNGKLTVNSGITFDIAGNLSIGDPAHESDVNIANDGLISLSGNFTYTGADTNFGNFTYKGNDGEIAAGRYNNLTVSGDCTRTLMGAVTVDNALSLEGAKGVMGSDAIITLEGDNKVLTCGSITASYATINNVNFATAQTVSAWNVNTNTVNGSGNTNLTIDLGGTFKATAGNGLIYGETLKDEADIIVTYSLRGQNATLLGSTDNSTIYAVGAQSETIAVSAAGYAFSGYTTFEALFAFTVNPKSVTISGIIANNKTYDGNTDVTIDCSSATVSGTIGVETLTINADNAVGAFADANADNNKTVTVTGITLLDGENGGLASNYTLASDGAKTKANIYPLPLPTPANVSVNRIENTEADIRVTWDAVSQAVGYKYRYKNLTQTSEWGEFSEMQNERIFTVANVIVGDLYEFQVVACGEENYGDSDEVQGQYQFVQMPQVTGLKASYLTIGKITFEWNTIPGIAKFAVSSQRNADTPITQDITNNSYAVDLAEFDTYRFQVNSITPIERMGYADVNFWVPANPVQITTQPFTIDNEADLQALSDSVNTGTTFTYKGSVLPKGAEHISFVLTSDLNLGTICNSTNGVSWSPIGTSGNPFAGHFDGNNHTISNLYINAPTSDYQGLFGYMDGGSIDSLNLVNTNITGQNHVGGVCGLINGNISNCTNTGSVSGTSYVGGVCGMNTYGNITNHINTGSVSGTSYVGGVCGMNTYGNITNCINTGNVSRTSYVGGVCGHNVNGSTITNCYYDKQMCTVGGINGSDVAGQAEGKLTTEMTGTTLRTGATGAGWTDEHWVFTENMYPRVKGVENTDAAIVAATPVFLYVDQTDNTKYETVDSISTKFMVGTLNNVIWNSLQNKITFENTNAIVDANKNGCDTLVATLNMACKHIFIYINEDANTARPSLNSENNVFNIYPNPATEYIYLISEPTEMQNEIICIYDATGRLVIQQRRTNSKIMVSALEEGIYQVCVIQPDKKIKTARFIKCK